MLHDRSIKMKPFHHLPTITYEEFNPPLPTRNHKIDVSVGVQLCSVGGIEIHLIDGSRLRWGYFHVL